MKNLNEHSRIGLVTIANGNSNGAMARRRLLSPIILFIGTLFLLAEHGVAKDGNLLLAEGGKPSVTIVLANDAIPAERTAAEQLQKYLQLMSSAEFSILIEEDVPVENPQIIVGVGPRTKELLPQEDWGALGTDGIVIKTVGSNLILAGGQPRGTLYAVFQFLEDTLGCQWWTPTEQTIPKVEELSVPSLDVRYVPEIAYREYFSSGVRYHPEFATFLRQNGSHQQQAEAWGGHFDILGFVHTFSKLLPPERYFAEHPEWYTDPARGSLPCTKDSTMPDGQKTQLCLSNPEVLKELTHNALELIRKNPEAGYISISQNDYTANCHCAACQKIVEQEGSESGPILKFVNAVAAEIDQHYPHFWVETMAYTYSEKPPKTIRPAKNVLIRLALALADYGHPIDSEWNDPARERLLEWAKISPNLFLWTYATNFKKVIFPHPNWNSLAEDLRFFSSHNVQGMFVQGDCYTGNVGDFPHLRTWLVSHLLWDPSQDQKALTARFLNGYYGPAAPYLQQYLDLIQDSFLSQKRGLNTNNRDFSFFTLDVSEKSKELFAKAEAAVADDEVLLHRVRREGLSPSIARIFQDRALRAEAMSQKLDYPSREEVERELVAFEKTADEFDLELWGENLSVEDGIAEIRKIFHPIEVELPEFAHSVPRGDVIDFQPSMMTLAMEGSLTKIEVDPAASGGKAASMVTRSKSWLVQTHLGSYLDSTGEDWRVFAVVRPRMGAESTGKGIAFEGGLYSDSGMKSSGRFTVDFNRLSEGSYEILDLGTHSLDPGMMLWFAPVNANAAEEILFDRVFFVRASAGKGLKVR